MNKFLNGLKEVSNYTTTENGAITYKSTKNHLLDMFAMGAAMRTRSDEDIILMFRKAYSDDPVYALKCLFYIRDVRGGQGERRFFRVCIRDLVKNDIEAMRRNLKYIPIFGRWDDLYTFVGTSLEQDAFEFIKEQLALDVQSKTPSLLAKWLKSENTSSNKSKMLGSKTRQYLKMSHKQYRKTLSILRERINIVERLMSAGEWDKIEFDKIPSRAGMIYKNAFARHDLEREQANTTTYESFMKDEKTKVNAKTLYPYECVAEALNIMTNWNKPALDDVKRLAVNKYWDNLADYFKEASFNGMAIVDTSGSMYGYQASAPINVAISLGMYCAEKAKGPYANHFITFSSNPSFVEVEGVDFCDKVYRMHDADWGGSTNIEAAFDMILKIAAENKLSQDEIPQNLIIISDMEFNHCVTSGPVSNNVWGTSRLNFSKETLFESMRNKWASYGYQMPKLTFWNVEARQNNIPMQDDGNVRYVSGMSPVIFEQVMKDLSAVDLMMDKLNSERYACIG